MTRLLYTLAVHALLPWAFLHLLWRARRQPAYLRHWGERLGGFLAVTPSGDFIPPAPTLWIHAVSVGETRAAQPVIAALRERYPNHRILLTHMTPTGRATSEALFGDSIHRAYLPYDTPWAVERFLDAWRPSLGLIMETELWPNLIAACRRREVPLHLVNARLSERSARRYARFPALTADALRHLAGICAQTEADAARLRTLGAPAVQVTGNVKFDIAVPDAQRELGRRLRARCGDRPVWLAASTREGEEALILDAWARVGAGSSALLVIVPRHPQRFDAVAALAAARGFAVQRRSADAMVDPACTVLIGDSMGEMFAYYAMADVAFIGGSLLDYGSQNLIEACAVGTPVLVGSSTRNFAEAAAGAISAGAAMAITDADSLVAIVRELLEDAERRAAMRIQGRAFAELHRGATTRTLSRVGVVAAPSSRDEARGQKP